MSDLIERLRRQLDEARAEREAMANVLPGVYYMAPPDGGDVSLLKQLQRMSNDAARYRLLRRKFAIISDGEGNAEFCPINLPRPTYIAPNTAIELDTALDRERLGLDGAKRPPTPVGWSDTDWIKHLQEQAEQPHPLAGQHINAEVALLAEAAGTAADEIERLTAELETERMRLTACGVAALANTADSAARARDIRPEYRSASLDDVERAVDREIQLRDERDELRRQISEAETDARRYRDWLRGGANIPPESNRWPRWEVRCWNGRFWNTLFAEAMDAAIDEAMGLTRPDEET